MFHVEFIGIPGAGKSTVRSALLRELKKADQPRCLGAEEAFLRVAQKRIDKVFRIILNFLPGDWGVQFIKKIMNRSLMQFESQNDFIAHHGAALNVFLASPEFRDLSYNDRKIVIGGFLGAGSFYQAISEHLDDSAVVFFDECFVQKSIMFISHSKHGLLRKEHVFEYLNRIPLPDLIIYVKTNPARCRERMMKRSKGLTQRLMTADDDAVARFLGNGEAHLNDVVEWLKKEGRTTVLEVANDDSLHETIKKLVTLLPQHVRN